MYIYKHINIYILLYPFSRSTYLEKEIVFNFQNHPLSVSNHIPLLKLI